MHTNSSCQNVIEPPSEHIGIIKGRLIESSQLAVWFREWLEAEARLHNVMCTCLHSIKIHCTSLNVMHTHIYGITCMYRSRFSKLLVRVCLAVPGQQRTVSVGDRDGTQSDNNPSSLEE